MNTWGVNVHDRDTPPQRLSSRDLHYTGPYEKNLPVKSVPLENTSCLQISIFIVLSGGAFLRPVSSRSLCLGPCSKGAILWKTQQGMRALMGRTRIHQMYFRWWGLIKIRPQEDVNPDLGIFVHSIVFSVSLTAFYLWASDSRSVFIKIILLCFSTRIKCYLLYNKMHFLFLLYCFHYRSSRLSPVYPVPPLPAAEPHPQPSPHCWPCPWALFLFCWIPPPPKPTPRAVSLLSICESVSILLVS